MGLRRCALLGTLLCELVLRRHPFESSISAPPSGPPPTPAPQSSQDKLVDPSSVTHMFKITETIGCVMTGVLPDSKSAVMKARQMAAAFEFDNGYPVPVAYLAKKIADENQIYTQAAYKRSMACIMILGRCARGRGGGARVVAALALRARRLTRPPHS